MSSELWIALIGIASTIVSGWASHFFTRKKYHSEVDSNVIENMQKSLDFYTKLSDDNKARLEEALRRNDSLEEEVKQLREQLYKLMFNICYDLTCSARQKVPINGIADMKDPSPESDEGSSNESDNL